MKRMNLLGLWVLMLALSSCQMKAEDAAESSSPETVATIDGIWATECIEDGSDSQIKSFEVADGTMTIAMLRYVGTRYCEQDKLSLIVMQSGSLTIVGDHASISGGKNYEWQLTAVVLIPNDVATTNMLNADSVCGSNSWATGQPGVVFGCAGTGFDLTQVGFNMVHYGVFVIESNVTPNYLQFETACELAGYQHYCPSANDRPSSVDGIAYYKE